MTVSPLEFAKEFAALKSKVGQQHAGDTQLLTLADFWPRLDGVRDNQSYRSYLDEYRALFADTAATADFSDCSPEELLKLGAVADAIGADDSRSIKKALIRQYAYLGETQEAVNVALGITGEISVPAGLVPLGAGCDLPAIEQPDLRSEFERFKTAAESFQEKAPCAAEMLQQIATEWDAASGHLWFDRARCLFVESDGSAQSRGRMRTFVGSVERLEDKRRAKTETQPDEVVFESQVKSADDPFIGVVYNSLSAVRHLLSRAEGKRKPEHAAFRARFEIAESKQVITGDSIGLAAALVAYAQLLRPEILRYDRFVSSDVVFTASIAPDGRLLPVNADTLPVKLRRAFSSPVRYVVLPKASADTAESILSELQKLYPRRRMQLIAAEDIRDVIEDRNVVRTERVCIGQFVGRKASKWTRTTKVQVPLLFVLLYVLICLIYPKAGPWFDWHIAGVKIEGDRFRTVNARGQTIWRSEPFEYQLNHPQSDDKRRSYWATDTDGDGREELFFAPSISTVMPTLVYYDHDGSMIWRKSTCTKTRYPGDTGYPDCPEMFNYNPADIQPYVDRNGHKFALTDCAANWPWRFQIMAFDTSGCVSGPFLTTGAGALGNSSLADIDSDGESEIITGGTDNRVERVVMIALKPLKLSGVNPPYDDSLYRMSGMPRGSQIRYVSLPETPLSQDHEVKSALAGAIKFDTLRGVYFLVVAEGYSLPINGVKIEEVDKLPHVYWTLDRDFIPLTLEFEDGAREQINQLMVASGRSRITDFEGLRESMLREVVVYHGDSLVYHPAKGIYFNSKKSR